MQQYTEDDLGAFKGMVAAIEQGETFDNVQALRFHMLGWLRQLDFHPIRWEVTELGTTHL